MQQPYMQRPGAGFGAQPPQGPPTAGATTARPTQGWTDVHKTHWSNFGVNVMTNALFWTDNNTSLFTPLKQFYDLNNILKLSTKSNDTNIYIVYIWLTCNVQKIMQFHI